MLAFFHLFEKPKVLFDRAIAIGAVFSRFGQGAAILPHLVGVKLADERLTGFDQMEGDLIQLPVVVAGMILVFTPVKPEPADIPHDRFGILHLLFLGVGVVQAKVAASAIFFSQTEVQGD